jgi:hypothetical protein
MPITLEAVEAEVRGDVKLGLAALLTPTAGCAIDHERTMFIDDQDTAVVYWSYTGRHTREFRNLQPFLDKGEPPGGDDVTVEGLTVVRQLGGDVPAYTFERHIDWNAVVAQLGASRGRSHQRAAAARPRPPAV